MSRKQTIKRLKGNASGASELLPQSGGLAPKATSTEPRENPAPPFSRAEIREVSKRVMGSRESGRKQERSRQHRQPKRGHGSQRRGSA